MATENALNFLRNPRRPPAPFYLIAGPQAFLREYVLETLRTRFTASGYQTRTFQIGGGDGFDALLSELGGADLFAAKRFIACRMLKTHRDRGEEESPEGTTRTGGGETAMAAALERVGAAIGLVLLYERDNAPIKLRRVADQAGLLINCPRPFDNQIAPYAEIFARAHGLELAPDAAELLALRHGSDLAALANLMAQQAITRDEPRLEVRDFLAGDDAHRSGPARVPELFELAESVVRGDLNDTLALFDRAVQTGRDPIELLAVEIIPLLRRMLVAATLLQRRKGNLEIARALALPPSSQLLNRAVDGARRCGLQRLQQAHQRAVTLDARFKNGLCREREHAIAGLLLELMAPPAA